MAYSYGTMLTEGISLFRINRHPVVKGMGNSTTTTFDVVDRETGHLVLLSLAETVATRIRVAGYCSQLISVSLRTNEFYHCSHQRKIYTATDCTKTIHHLACDLFDELWQGQPIRHLGVSASELCRNDFFQMTLFEELNEK